MTDCSLCGHPDHGTGRCGGEATCDGPECDGHPCACDGTGYNFTEETPTVTLNPSTNGVSGLIPTDDSPSATVIADVPGAVGRLGTTSPDWNWQVDAATLTFTETGADHLGRPLAQIVVYAGRAADERVGATYGASIELTVDDAEALLLKLTAWTAMAREAEAVLPVDGEDSEYDGDGDWYEVSGAADADRQARRGLLTPLEARGPDDPRDAR